MAIKEYETELEFKQELWWGSPEGGTYLSGAATAKLYVSVDPDFHRAHCELTDYSESFMPGDLRGGGFVNIGGCAWAQPDFSSTYNLPDVTKDTFERAWSEMYQACPALRSDLIIGVAVDDRDCKYERQQGSNWARKDILLGGVRPTQGVEIVCGIDRRWVWEGIPDAERYSWCHKADDAMIYFGEPPAVAMPYYPWASRFYRNNSVVWLSCDRKGGSLTLRQGGAWRDCKNNVAYDRDDTVWYKKDGAWLKAPITGEV